MKKRDKLLAIIATASGSAGGALVCWLLLDFEILNILVSFFAFFGLLWMAVLVISVVNDVRREERERQQRYNNRKASWFLDEYDVNY